MSAIVEVDDWFAATDLAAVGRYVKLHIEQRIFGLASRRHGTCARYGADRRDGEPKIACTKPLPRWWRLWGLNQGEVYRDEVGGGVEAVWRVSEGRSAISRSRTVSICRGIGYPHRRDADRHCEKAHRDNSARPKAEGGS